MNSRSCVVEALLRRECMKASVNTLRSKSSKFIKVALVIAAAMLVACLVILPLAPAEANHGTNEPIDAECSTTLADTDVLQKGEPIGVTLTYRNRSTDTDTVGFTATMKENKFFGPEHQVGGASVSRGFASQQPVSIPTDSILDTGTDQIIIEITSNATGSTVLARCTSTVTILPPGAVDLQPTAIEVTQSIQDLQNSVVLVEGKRTFVRVHVGSNVDAPRVTARLYGYDASGTPLPEGPLQPANPRAQVYPKSAPDRGELLDSFYFVLPPSWTKGTVTLKAEINPLRTLTESDYSNNAESVTVGFQPTNALKVAIIPYVAYDLNGVPHPPQDDSLDAIESRLRREYPISKLSVDRRPRWDDNEVRWDFAKDSSGTTSYKLLNRLVYSKVYPPPDPGVVYLLVANKNLIQGGKAEDISRPDSPKWNAVVGESPQNASHEIGHLMGRLHVSCTSSTTDEDFPDIRYPYEGGKIGGPTGDTSHFYGFDAGDSSLAVPVMPQVVANDTGDVMSYCDTRWLSDYNYSRIREYIQQTFSAVDPEGDYLAIYGTIDFDEQTVSLPLVSRRPRVSEVPPLVEGPYHIRLFDAANRQLADYPFTPSPDVEGESMGLIGQIVDFVPGTRRIAVYSELAGRELASVTVSANPPNVSEVAAYMPSEGESIDLSWSQSDPDGDRLTSTILYSDDSGTEWQTIASGVDGTSYSVEPSELPGTGGTASGLFRVLVGDGVLTDEATSAPFDLPGKAPEARIAAPLTGTTYVVGQSTDLEGIGEDLEDGTLEDAKLSWSSDLDGPLGIGRLLHVQELSEGAHNVTLTATDSDGQTDTETIVVNVVDNQGSLDPDDSTPPTIDCAAPNTLWHPSDVSIACTANDGGSGLANANDANFSLFTDVPAGTEDSDALTTSRNVCDKMGNCAVAGSVAGNKVDKRAPSIVISTPANGTTYRLRQTVVADYACIDGGSGVTSCSGTAPDGGSIDTSSPGSKAFRVEAADDVGNKDSRTVNYEVIYDFSGFFSPVENPNVLNQVKAGSAIPVKFGLGGDQGLNIFAKAADGSSYPKSAAMSCDSTDPVDDIEQTVTANASGLTYDATTDRYTYVWKTSKEWRGCRQLVMKLNDGSFHRANFKFTK
jgi:hypothetical protein